MKNRIISAIGIILCLIILMSAVTSHAYSGEIDPKNYIDFSSSMTITDNKGSGTITISSEAVGYNLSYQKVDMNKEKFDKITGLNDQSEILNEIPDFTSSWTEVSETTTSNKIEVDFKDFTGTAYYVIWAKLTNGTDTYYDCGIYSSEIKDQEEKPSDEGWTDFSNAKYELKKEGVSGAELEISGVTKNKDSFYYLYLTNNAIKPDVDGKSAEGRTTLSYDENTKSFHVLNDDWLRNAVELNQDIYASVFEMRLLDGKIVDYGKKLTRFSEPNYSDAFSATFVTESSDQIITTFTHYQGNNRKLQIKIGKVTDTSILQKIKDKDKTGFEKLLNYAKTGSSIFNQTVMADKDDSFAIEYNAGGGSTKGNSVLSIKGFEDNAYYYLYVKPDDENRKYFPTEAVTLATAKTFTDGKYSLFFYGKSDFKWSDWGTSTGEEKKNTTVNTTANTSAKNTTTNVVAKDNTIAPTILPNTGKEAFIVILIVGTVLIGAVGWMKVNKYKDI